MNNRNPFRSFDLVIYNLYLMFSRWKVNEKIVVTDVTINDKSTGNDLTVTMRESHQPEGFFGGQKLF